MLIYFSLQIKTNILLLLFLLLGAEAVKHVGGLVSARRFGRPGASPQPAPPATCLQRHTHKCRALTKHFTQFSRLYSADVNLFKHLLPDVFEMFVSS